MSPHEPQRPQDNAWGCDQFVAGESHGPCGICPGCMRRANPGGLSVAPDASLRALIEQWRSERGAFRLSGQYDAADMLTLCADELESLLSARAGAETPHWQPIETAPVGTSTEVLLCWDDGIAAPMFAVGYNLGDGRRWQTTHEWLHNDHSWPTHWMPLPSPPVHGLEPPPHEPTR